MWKMNYPQSRRVQQAACSEFTEYVKITAYFIPQHLEDIMSEIKSREDGPVPGVEYSEINIPDDKEMGTGSFTTMIEPKAMKKINPIISSIQNEPVFLMIVSINLAIEQATAMIGKSHNTPPLDRKVFNIPKDIDLLIANDFSVSFSDWDLQGMTLNGISLKPAEA
jgi:hypothetical protein